MAERALHGVGDPQLGEWRERGHNGIVHLRRRLTQAERAAPGRPTTPLEVRDIRGSEEEQRRFRRLFRDAPHLRGLAS